MFEGLDLIAPIQDWEREVVDPWLSSEQTVEDLKKNWEAHVARRRALMELIPKEGAQKYAIKDIRFLLSLLIGPYKGWHAIFDRSELAHLAWHERTFKELIKIRTLITRVRDIAADYPKNPQLVAGYVPNSEWWQSPFILDGSHTTEAMARILQVLPLSAGYLPETNPTLVLVPFTEQQRELIFRRILPEQS